MESGKLHRCEEAGGYAAAEVALVANYQKQCSAAAQLGLSVYYCWVHQLQLQSC